MGRPRIYADDAERQRAFRARRRLKQQEQHALTAMPGEAPTRRDDSLAEPPQAIATNSAAPASDNALASIWAMIEEIWKDVPEEEMAKLPVDGATQHDHYIYGTPKRYR